MPTVRSRSRSRYRPVPCGSAVEQQELEWARLYTEGEVESGTEMAAAEGGTAAPHRQQFRQCQDAAQETVLSAPRASATAASASAATTATIASPNDDDNARDNCDTANGTRTRQAGLGAAFATIPETHIARTHATHAARPAHIRANPLASPHFRGGPPVAGSAPVAAESATGAGVVSPRFEIPLTPPDAPPTPPGALPKGTTMPLQGATTPLQGATTPAGGARMACHQRRQQERRATGRLWRLGAAARQ